MACYIILREHVRFNNRKPLKNILVVAVVV